MSQLEGVCNYQEVQRQSQDYFPMLFTTSPYCLSIFYAVQFCRVRKNQNKLSGPKKVVIGIPVQTVRHFIRSMRTYCER